ncbi:zinc-ribbon domain-containing protein [Simkania sp.]
MEYWYCPKCGSTNSDEDSSCRFCGYSKS